MGVLASSFPKTCPASSTISLSCMWGITFFISAIMPFLSCPSKLEECNYNMIDNVLNNEKPKEEKEHKAGRVSIKEKLAEKKAVIEQRDKSGKVCNVRHII